MDDINKNTDEEKNLPSEEKSENKNSSLNTHIKTLIDTYHNELVRSKQSYTPVHVDEIVTRLAKFYEKIRKVIDWKDDNTLRRGSIERILKRILFPKLAGFQSTSYNSEILAETVTTELIRGGHLPNHKIPKERIKAVSDVVYKYLYFLEYFSQRKSFTVKQKSNIATFTIELAACEVEEILTNPVKEQGVIAAMTQILNERIAVTPSNLVEPDEKLRLIYISSLRTLYDLDDNYITYQLLKRKYAYWHTPNEDQLKHLAELIPNYWKHVHDEINTPKNGKFDSIAERIDTVFMLIDDILENLKNTPEKIFPTFENKQELTKQITKAYEKRYNSLRTRLFHLAVFSTLSVFMSNWVTFFIVEIPLARLFYEGFNLTAAIADFLIPTIAMFVLVVIIRPPKKENLKNIIATTLSFVYNEGGQEHYQVRISEKRSKVFNIFMSAIYIVTAWFVFAGIAYVFYVAQLPITSVIFDTFTIALTVFAAVVIRNQSKELNVDEDRSTFEFLLDIITLPIAKVGSILAKKWKEYNIVAIFFNFAIETPLVAVFNFIQGWSEYLKERRSEMH